MNINHYHHLGAEEKRLLQDLVQAATDITSRLKQIEEQITIMSEQEQQLDQKLTDLQTALDASQERALKAIETANAATETVKVQVEKLTALVEDLKANQPDLTDEIGQVETIIADANAFLGDNPPIDTVEQPKTDETLAG